MSTKLTIEQVATLSGFSTRSIRGFIKNGFLEGDKSTGKWLFTFEQYQAFTNHPAISPTVSSKKLAGILSFLNEPLEDNNRICVILDVRKEDAKAATKFFLTRLAEFETEDADMTYSSDTVPNGSRHIIYGTHKDVTAFLEGYEAVLHTEREND